MPECFVQSYLQLTLKVYLHEVFRCSCVFEFVPWMSTPVADRSEGRRHIRWLLWRCSPLPIPNREVKPAYADGTALQCGRVGSRLLFFSEGHDPCNPRPFRSGIFLLRILDRSLSYLRYGKVICDSYLLLLYKLFCFRTLCFMRQHLFQKIHEFTVKHTGCLF